MEQLKGIVCARCGSVVFKSEVDGYYAYCPYHDEDLYEFETINLVEEAKSGKR